jgi:hypothetical protein
LFDQADSIEAQGAEASARNQQVIDTVLKDMGALE